MLNLALNIGMIFDFNNSLRYNFIHLRYADDLILITSASRQAARNINLYLNIYAGITEIFEEYQLYS